MVSRSRGEPEALLWSVFGVAVFTVLLVIAVPAAFATSDASGAGVVGGPTVGFSPSTAPRRVR